MARGWDSKAVEEQQAAAAEDRSSARKPERPAAERERQAKRDSLLLARARLVHDLAAATAARHKTMLEAALAHLDREIAAIE